MRMYARHFGLQHEPFSISPDPRYLFMSERHREALAHLLYGLQSGGGFVLLTGEIGAGKTTVCRAFLEQVPANNHVAYIFNPKLTAAELLQSVCDEFAVTVVGSGIKAQVDALNAYLLRTHAAGENNVLVIDEAQSLSADVLEQLRLLTNLETNERKLLQIILIGQPELRSMLARPELEQLAQRVIARFHLGPLDAPDTARYMRHRLAVAGATGVMPFDRAARLQVHKLTAGVPRRINLLCDRALLGAFAAGAARVDKLQVDAAAREVFAGPDSVAARSRLLLWFWPATSLVMALLCVSVLVHFWPWTVPVPGVVQKPIAGVIASVREALDATADSRSGLAAGSTAASTAKAPVSGSTAATPALGAASQAMALAHPVVPVWSWPAQPTLETAAWRDIAVMWNVSVVDLSTCETSATQGVRCFRTPAVSLALLRQLARPGIVSLQAADGSKTRALLMGMSGQDALLQADGATRSMPLATFGTLWLGDFGTLYRSDAPGSSDKRANALWLTAQLDRLPQTGASMASASSTAPAASTVTTPLTLVKRVQAFQRAHGLVSDGVPGAMTLMQINRALGVAEPRWSTPSP